MQLVIILLLAAHLLAMNLASAGPLAAVWLRSVAGGAAASRRVAFASLAALAIGGLLGTGLLLAPNPPLRAALQRFPARAYWFAGAELAFSAACMLAIALLPSGGRRRRAWQLLGCGLALATVTNLLYHFPPWMGVIGKLVVNPSWAPHDVLGRAELLPLMGRTEIIALSSHFTLASLTVAALAAAWLLDRPGVDELQEAERSWAQRRLAAAALLATLLQLGVGIWLLASLNEGMRGRLLGGRLLAAVAFFAGLLTTLKMSEQLGAAVFATSPKAPCRKAARWLVITVLLMTGAMAFSREADGATVGGSDSSRFEKSTAARI